MRFDDYPVHDLIKQQLAYLGFKKPTDIQFKAIKPVMEGEDVFAIAQTGTGKTAAFVIPILDALMKKKAASKAPRCLVMAPTRELAHQICGVFEDIGKKTDVRIASVMGGVGQDDQIA